VAAIEDAEPSTRDEIGCVFEGWVDIIGLDTLDEAGVTPDELAQSEDFPAVGLEVSETQARDAADVFFDCADLVELFALSEYSEQDVSCVRTALENSDTELREVMKNDLLGSDETELVDEIDQVFRDQCGVSIYSD
jgi:hypothetical protein